ncbi:hypothetical protein [Spirosoma sp.]|uniref:hypothetical protein n=1 Tax=Spirosoma sp. TaxID=1899569 RepID=UPI00260D94F3|nr:hypothetical protein [Spirosoma sp.]MCX6214582.1 hypothetical protein [Spirosoma sp.]
MKNFFSFLTVLAIVALSSANAQPPRVYIDGSWYTHEQTAYIKCTTSPVLAVMDPACTDASCTAYKSIFVTTSSNFSHSNVNTNTEQIVLDYTNHYDGYIDVAYAGDPAICRIHIVQKPGAATFTATPSICSTGSSATYTLAVNYPFNSTNPLNIKWYTSGGVTVNGGSTYTATNTTTSSVTVQWSSFGTIYAHGEIPGCGNVAGAQDLTYVGTPSSSNITFATTGGGDNGSSFCVGNTRNYQSNPNLPLSRYNYNWSIPSGSSNVSYFYSYGPNATVTAGSTGGFLLQMDVTQSGCSSTGGSSRTFFINNCGGFRVANNPSTDNITAVFDKDNDTQYLPDVLRLSTEKNGVVKEVKIKGQYSDQAAKDGFSVNIDVHTLPRGTYYLQGINNTSKSESIRVILQ